MENIGNDTLHYLEIFNNGTGKNLSRFSSAHISHMCALDLVVDVSLSQVC